MNFRSVMASLLVAFCASCTRYSEAPTSLVGTFRTRAPITAREIKPSLYWQYRFSTEQVAVISTVEKSGTDSGRGGDVVGFAFKGSAIEVRPFEPLGLGELFCAPNLTYVNEDRLLVAGSDYILTRVKE